MAPPQEVLASQPGLLRPSVTSARMVAAKQTMENVTPQSARTTQDFVEDLIALGREHARLGTLHKFEDYLRSLEAHIDMRLDVEAQRGWKAIMLAPNIEICRALLRGERVPWNTLNYFQAERFGLKKRSPDWRYGLDDFNDVRRS